MDFKIIDKNNSLVAVIAGNGVLVNSAQDILDIIASARHLHGCTRLIVKKENITEDFFNLKTGVAGEVLQKVINYNAALAIIGDFSTYTSKALKDFIYESNQGRQIFFLADENEAVERLAAFKGY